MMNSSKNMIIAYFIMAPILCHAADADLRNYVPEKLGQDIPSFQLRPRAVVKMSNDQEKDFERHAKVSITNMNILKEQEGFCHYPIAGFGSWAGDAKTGGLITIENYKDGKPGKVARRNQKFPTWRKLTWKAGKQEVRNNKIKKQLFDLCKLESKLKKVKDAFVPDSELGEPLSRPESRPHDVEYEWPIKLKATLNNIEYKSTFVEKYVVDKRILQTFQRKKRYEYLRTQLKIDPFEIGNQVQSMGPLNHETDDTLNVPTGARGEIIKVDDGKIEVLFEGDKTWNVSLDDIRHVQEDNRSDAIGLQEVDGTNDWSGTVHDQIIKRLQKTHKEFKYQNSPKSGMHGRMFLSKKKFNVIKLKDFPEGMRVEVTKGTHTGKTGTVVTHRPKLGVLMVLFDGEKKLDNVKTVDVEPLFSLQSKKFAPKHPNELDYQNHKQTGERLERTFGVVVPVTIEPTGQKAIFASFHFKSGTDPNALGQRPNDCEALLKAVRDLKKILGGGDKKFDCPTFLFGDANADGNTRDIDGKPKTADEVFRRVRKEYGDVLGDLFEFVITSWKKRFEGNQPSKQQVEHMIYGDPCWYNEKWATPCEVKMPWLLSQLREQNNELKNTNFCMIRPGHPSDHCTTECTFYIFRKPYQNIRRPLSLNDNEDMDELVYRWKDYNTTLKEKGRLAEATYRANRAKHIK